MRELVGDSHHEAAEQEREVLLVALVAELLLNVRDRNDVDADVLEVGGELFGEGEDLLARALGGVRKALEVERVHLHAAARH